MLSLAIWLAIMWACFGVGAAALRVCRARSDSWAEEIPLAVALGMGILAYLVLAAGLLGYLKVWVGIGLVCLLAALGWRHMARLAAHVPAAIRSVPAWRWGVVLPLLFLVTTGLLTLIGALAPPADSDYDGLVYHLAIPKVYIADGRIHAIPWLSHSNFPFALEMLYLLGLLLRDQALAKLFHFGCGWLTVCAIFAFGRRWWNADAGWWGAAMFAAVPLVTWEMMSAYNELAFALYAFLAIYALARWLEGRQAGERHGWLWVAGIMCGLALGVKLLAGAVFLFALGALVWALLRHRSGWRGLAQIAGFAAIAIAVAAPWYLKSYLWTGNPVYPFLYGVFGGRYWSADRAQEYTAAQRAFGLGRGPLAFLALPWNLTMNSQAFFDQPDRLTKMNVMIWVFGPLLLAFAPTLLATRPLGGRGRLVLWFALVYAAIWFAMSQNGRYLIPLLPGLCACAGFAAAQLLARRGIAAPAAAAALILALLSGVSASWRLAAPAQRVALGIEPPSVYLSRVSPLYPMLEAVNRATPPEAKILVLGNEPRMFYLDRAYLLGAHANIFSAADLASPDSLLASLKRMGVTHVLLHVSALEDVAARRGAIESDLAGLEADGTLRPVGMYGKLSLWELADGSSARAR